MRGKTCLITGAGTSVGREVARNLAKMGAVVVIAGADFGLLEETRSSIHSQLPQAALDPINLDMSKRLSLLDFFGVFGERHDRLDVIVNVIHRSSRTKIETEFGVDITWGMNVLGPFMVIRRLAEVMARTPPTRVVNVVSPYAGGMDLDDTDFDTRSYSGIKAYRQSMQAARLMTYAAAGHLAIYGIMVNACVPGVVRGDPGAGLLSNLLAMSPVAAAESPTWLATSPDAAAFSGRLVMGRQETKCKFRDGGVMQRVWETLEMQAAR
ncbi:MAG: SDR family NAD(P)-dependent oxidoreductase [Nannocystaceae bacterium]